MGGLAQGRPIVVGAGRLTEPVWRDERCVALASSVEPDELIRLAEACLADPEERARLSAAALSTYERFFSVERVVERITRSAQP
jgi:glycosyltransferase involved in cell wall biosynthesis